MKYKPPNSKQVAEDKQYYDRVLDKAYGKVNYHYFTKQLHVQQQYFKMFSDSSLKQDISCSSDFKDGNHDLIKDRYKDPFLQASMVVSKKSHDLFIPGALDNLAEQGCFIYQPQKSKFIRCSKFQNMSTTFLTE